MESKKIALNIIDEIIHHLGDLHHSIVRYTDVFPYEKIEEKPKPTLSLYKEEKDSYTLEDLGLSANPLDDFKDAKKAIALSVDDLLEKGSVSSENKTDRLLQEYSQAKNQKEELIERCDDFLTQLQRLDMYSKEGKKELTKHCDLVLASIERLEADCSFLKDSITSE